MKVLIDGRRTGKTTKLLEIAHDQLIRGKSVLFVLPHLGLLKYTLDMFRKKYPTLDYSYNNEHEVSYKGATLYFRTNDYVSSKSYMWIRFRHCFKIYDNFDMSTNVNYDIISINGETIEIKNSERNMLNQKTVDLYQFILENKESLKKDVEYKLELNYLTDPWLKHQIERQVCESRREHLIRNIFHQTDYTYEEVMVMTCEDSINNLIIEILED